MFGLILQLETAKFLLIRVWPVEVVAVPIAVESVRHPLSPGWHTEPHRNESQETMAHGIALKFAQYDLRLKNQADNHGGEVLLQPSAEQTARANIFPVT